MEQYVNFGTTTLTASLAGTSTATLFSVGSPGNLPTTPQFRCNIDNEIVLVTALSTTTSTVTFTCSRGQENTAVALHTSGAAVTNVLSTGAFNQIRSDINQSGLLASLPSTPLAGDTYRATDTPYMFVYSGSTWNAYGPITPLTVPPGTASWTVFGSTTDLTIANAANGPITLTQRGQNVHQAAGIVLSTITGTPHTITACLAWSGQWGDFVSYGLCYRASGTGGLVTLGPASVTNISYISMDKYTNSTTYNANYHRNVWAGGGVVWLRMTDDGTNRTGYFSADGINYYIIHTQGRTDFITPNQVGIFIDTEKADAVAGPSILTVLSWTYV